MARLSLVPKDREFFNLFDEAGTNILHSAQLLVRLMKQWPDAGGLGREILICEQEGDRITHDIIHRLNSSSSATPIDRVDIYELASALDDVVDYTEEAADFLGLYHIEAPMEQAQQMADIVRDASLNIGSALAELRGFDLSHYFIEINRLENEGDKNHRRILAKLFSGEFKTIEVLKLKDVVESLEGAIDAFEKVANIVEQIAVKES